ncbi:sugar ABC transporter substrate-binding protein, partial [Halomonas sp. MG34]|nr:sugar ABC transporter substrate-binding protein [Halomonas sp. MG34]
MRALKFLFLGVVVALVLAACGDSEETQSKEGVIELTLWNDWTEDRPENTVYKDIIEKFNA